MAKKKKKSGKIGQVNKVKLGRDLVLEETTDAGKFRQRRLGLTERWMLNGIIYPREHAAGNQFAFDFEAAQLRGRYGSVDMEKVARSTSDSDGGMGRVVDAKRRVNAAMERMGQYAGAAVWSVLGEGMSLREFSQRLASNGKPVTVDEAKGRVISGLGILADYYGT